MSLKNFESYLELYRKSHNQHGEWTIWSVNTCDTG